MRYYIVDDEIGIVKTLENIIESRHLGEVIGYQTCPEKALAEITMMKPDIVLADLLMEGMDGISLVEQLTAAVNHLNVVMISRVTDKAMVEQAYRAGVDFFIHKPVNLIEVEKVLHNVMERVKMNQLVQSIRGMVDAQEQNPSRTVLAPALSEVDHSLKEIQSFLGMLGMAGEKGTADILQICRYLLDRDESYSRDALTRAAREKDELPRNMEQRIRRAIKKGLTNVASLGLDDYANEVFQVYANYVFDFRSIKEEMEYMKGRRAGSGRVSITKFVDGLLIYSKALE